MPSAKDYGDMHANERSEDDDKKAIDKYLNAELILNMGTHDERRGYRIKRTRGLDGEPIGCTLANPLLTPMSTIKFTDGTHKRYQANIIAGKNMYAQVNNKGNQYLLFKK